MASRIAALLPAHAVSFSAENGGASFVLKKDEVKAIEHLSGEATFIPVPLETVVRNSLKPLY